MQVLKDHIESDTLPVVTKPWEWLDRCDKFVHHCVAKENMILAKHRFWKTKTQRETAGLYTWTNKNGVVNSVHTSEKLFHTVHLRCSQGGWTNRGAGPVLWRTRDKGDLLQAEPGLWRIGANGRSPGAEAGQSTERALSRLEPGLAVLGLTKWVESSPFLSSWLRRSLHLCFCLFFHSVHTHVAVALTFFLFFQCTLVMLWAGNRSFEPYFCKHETQWRKLCLTQMSKTWSQRLEDPQGLFSLRNERMSTV